MLWQRLRQMLLLRRPKMKPMPQQELPLMPLKLKEMLSIKQKETLMQLQERSRKNKLGKLQPLPDQKLMLKP
jgi:hypothetical protein